MKKILFLIIAMIGIYLPYDGLALSGNITISCDKVKLNPGESTTCNIKANTQDGEVSSLHAKINLDSNLSLVSVTSDSIWEGDGEGGSLDLYTDSNKSDTFNIATFVAKANDGVYGKTSTISLSEVALYDQSFNEYALSANTVSIKHPSNVNTLSSLNVLGTTIDFSPTKTEYNLTVNDQSATITATPTENSASIVGAGPKTLNYGTNKFAIIVTAENGEKKTYTINITRPDNRSKDNNLATLKISNGTINFSASTTTYNVTLDPSTTATTITATAKDTKATIIGTGEKALNYGLNTVNVVVTAENGSTKTYTINITRKDNRDSNNNLSSLTISAGHIEFNKDKTNYTLSVPNDILQTDISATAASTKAKIEGTGNKSLAVGENIIIIKVTAENQTVKEYKITIIREKIETVTVNNNLKNLTITGHTINFNSNKKDYTIETTSNQLDIKVELENSESTYEILGNDDLQDGDIIQIIVTDKDGNNNIYRININKPNDSKQSEEKPQEKTTSYLPLILIIVFVLLLVVTIIVALKRWNEYKQQKEI